jgi:hypothetical protein
VPGLAVVATFHFTVKVGGRRIARFASFHLAQVPLVLIYPGVVVFKPRHFFCCGLGLVGRGGFVVGSNLSIEPL